jgi:hypothetical protein
MKPYGLPRNQDIPHADILDCHIFALKSSTSTLPNKKGDCRGVIRSKRKKRSTRRYWKRKARREGKIQSLGEDWVL